MHWNHPPIRKTKAAKLLRILNRAHSLKSLTDLSTSGMNAGERLMSYQICLLKTYEIKITVKNEWKQFKESDEAKRK
jgi:hypothetical protein